MSGKQNRTGRYFLILLLAVVPLFAFGLSNHGLWSADEPRVAEIGREMALTGNWVVPTLNGKPFLEEPPLFYGSLAVIFNALGSASDKIARLPSAIYAFGGVVSLFFMANLLFGPRIALLSGLVLATTGEYLRVAHWVVVDSALTFFVITAMTLFVKAYLSGGKGLKLLCYSLSYFSCTLAFYSKGFIGITVPGLAILSFLAAERNWKEILAMRVWLAILIFAILAFPWFFCLWQQAGTEYLRVFLLHNHLQRFLPASMAGAISGSASGHHHPFYYYLTQFPVGFLPWSILLLPALRRTFSKPAASAPVPEKGRLLATCWFFTGFVFLSIASTKRVLYLMPIFPPMAMLTAFYIDSTLTHQISDRVGKAFLWLLGILLLAVGTGLVPVSLYLRNLFPEGAPASVPASVLTVSALVLALSSGALWWLRHGKMDRYWIATCLSVISLLVFTLTVVLPGLDRHKSFVPFCRKLAEMVPVDQPLYTYEPDETLRGAVPFYTGRYLTELETPEKLATLLQTEGPFYVVIRDRGKKTERKVASIKPLNVLLKQEMGTDRTLLLLSNRYGSTLTLHDPARRRPGG